MGVGLDAVPKTWEGGFSAIHLGSALGVVRARSLTWNAKEIMWIAVYEIDEHGVVDLQPAIWQGFSNNSTYNPPDMNLSGADDDGLPAGSKYVKPFTPTRTVISTYDKAEWMDEIDLPRTYITMTLKETGNVSNDRS